MSLQTRSNQTVITDGEARVPATMWEHAAATLAKYLLILSIDTTLIRPVFNNVTDVGFVELHDMVMFFHSVCCLTD